MSEKRIKLAEAMGWTDFIGDYGLPPGARDARPNTHGHGFPPDPFTDANDERDVFRYVMKQRFSMRRAFWKEFEKIIRDRAGAVVAWPDILMLAEDGDMAEAALKVLE